MVNKIDGLLIDWDDSKNRSNIRKHKLSFTTAALVFADKNRVEFYDSKHSVAEDRYITIGVVNKLIVVIYVERKRTLRIISARIANSKERKNIMGKIVRRKIYLGEKPTVEQAKEVENASRYPISYDEDSPEFSYDEMLKMIEDSKKRQKHAQKQVVTLRLSEPVVTKAKAVGKGYTSFLSRLVENAMNDKDLVSRSL